MGRGGGGLAGGMLAGKMYAIGGVGPNRRNTNANEAYDPAQDRWLKLAPMPTPRDHHAIGVLNGKLYVIGGRINGRHDKSITANEEYDPAKDQWRGPGPLSPPRGGIVAGLLEWGKFFFLGG